MLQDIEGLITQTRNGYWYVKGDTLVHKWIEETGRLDHDQWAMQWISRVIKPGDFVIDVGANIGTHTHAYLNMVGPKGVVVAYEPSLPAFTCLERNCPGAVCSNLAVSDAIGRENMMTVHQNPGMNHLVRGPNGDIQTTTLDADFLVAYEANDSPAVSYIKIDVEGCEIEVLRGAIGLIDRDRPSMWIENNPGAQALRGNHPSQIEQFLREHHYRYQIFPDTATWESPQTDILCITP